jgi:hypothetical protein
LKARTKTKTKTTKLLYYHIMSAAESFPCRNLRLTRRTKAKDTTLVLGRFWESIRKDSILLAIFAEEREDSIQK